MTSTTNTTAHYYDHAKNQRNAAVAHAMAKAAREVKAEGTAYVVEFTTATGEIKFWSGCHYDALGLAKQIVRNGGAATLRKPNGEVLTADAIIASRY